MKKLIINSFVTLVSLCNWLAANHIPTLGIGVIKGGSLQQVNVYSKLNEGNNAPYNLNIT